VSISSSSRIEELLEEILRWTRLQGMDKLKAVIAANLRSESERLVYEYSDGDRSVRDIEATIGVSRSTVTRYWDKWQRLGIVEKSRKYEGRWKRLCSLEDLGIDVPQLPRVAGDQEAEKNQTLEAVIKDVESNQ